MSSFYDSSGYASRNDSIPIGESESDYIDDEASLYSGQATQEEEGEGERSIDRVDRARRRRGDASPEEPPPGLASSGATGLSSDFYSGQTSYLTPSDTMSLPAGEDAEDYTSGYGSLSYDYDLSDLRSPSSGSELSSTLVSFFYQNETIARVRAMGYFFRRPILFFLFTVGGNGALGGFLRASPVWTRGGGSWEPSLSAEALHRVAGVASGYPDVPGWLREIRGGLPAVVERPVAWLLRSRGVPILSELQQSSRRAADAIASKLHHSTMSWKKSGRMIPVSIFLPIFTYFALYIALRVIAPRAERSRLLLFGDELSQVDPVSGVESRMYSREYSELAFSSNLGLTFARDVGEGDDRQHSITTAPASMRDPLGSEPALDSPKGVQKGPLLPKLELPAEAAGPTSTPAANLSEDFELQEESPATTRPRSPTRRPAAARGGTPPPTSSPDPGATALLPPRWSNPTSRSRESSLPPQTPVLSRGGLAIPASMQLKGHQIVLVLLGTPSAMESNSVLVAALKYGVPAVLLPDTMANEPRLMAVPQTELRVEFARDPLSLALSRADELSMEVIAVYQTNDFAPDATSLFLFSHPARALYLFAPPSQEEALAPAIARTAAAPIFVGAVRRLERGIPANECLYDRLTKTQG